MNTPTPPPSKNAHKKFARRTLLAMVALSGLFVLAVMGTVGWLWNTTQGLAALIAVADRLTPGLLSARGVSGALSSRFGFESLIFDDGRIRLELQNLQADLAESHVGGRLSAVSLRFSNLSATRVAVHIRPSGRPDTGPPRSIALPFTLAVEQLRLAEFELTTGQEATNPQPKPTLAARAIEARVTAGPQGYRLQQARFEFGPLNSPLQVTLDGNVAGASPFALDAQAQLSTRLQQQALQAQLRATGSLTAMQLAADVAGAAGRGSAQAQVAAFDAPSLRQLQIQLTDLDPAAWVKTAPHALLTIDADLKPVSSSTVSNGSTPEPSSAQKATQKSPAKNAVDAKKPSANASGAATPFTLSGPVRVTNTQAGPLDNARVPVRLLRGTLELNARHARATELVAELSRGTARGQFELLWASNADTSWSTQLELDGVDPQSVHTRAQPLLVSGTVQARQANKESFVVADLRHRGAMTAQLNLDLRADPDKIQLNTARLQLDAGSAEASGQFELKGTQRLQLNGSVNGLDPALLVSGIQARINGRFNLDASLQPAMTGLLDFSLSDSQLFGRALAGSGKLALSAEQELDIDATLAAHSATLTARGGLGASGRQLAIALSAPQMQELGLPVAGSLTAKATLSGDWRAPAIDVDAAARTLRLGEHRVNDLQLLLTYAGGNDAALTLRTTVASHRFRNNPALSVQAATLTVSGRPSAHRIELAASTEDEQQLFAAADGGWLSGRQNQPQARITEARPPVLKQRANTATSGSRPQIANQAATQPQAAPATSTAPANGWGWSGRLLSLSSGAPWDLKLLAPVAVELNNAGWRIGPAALQALGAKFEELRAQAQGNTLITSGRFSELRPLRMSSSSAGSNAAGGASNGSNLFSASAATTPLTLRGEWDLRAGAQLDGRVLIERSAGDVTAGTQANAMGLSELRLQATARANRIDANLTLRGSRAGSVDASMQTSVERTDEGWRLAMQQPLAAQVRADVPSIAWVNVLLSEAVRTNVRLGGSINAELKVEGSLAAPLASGQMRGDNLRVAWIEQGLRLEGGRLAASISGGNEIVLEELRFSGPPRVAAPDRRLASVISNEEGFLAMSGRLQLRDLSGVLQMQASRLPILQRTDRWVLVSGGANLVLSEKQIQLNGALAANAGFVDFSRPNLPTLANDVQIVSSDTGNAAAKTREAPVGFNFDLALDFGPAFYLRGLGLDTRVEGVIRLRSEGRAGIRATGGVEAKDGVYEGFGQKLAIERGRVNWQGQVENPGLDILALRKGLPVQVGVSISRTAANPLIRLYSDEPMQDFQILSWLVLGRPAEESGADRTALATAAAGLLSGTGEGIPTQLARRLGIDEISVRSAQTGSSTSLLPSQSVAGSLRGNGNATAAGEIVTIGKRVGDAISISYEQALGGAESVVQLSYQLSRRLSLVARAGTNNALDLVYSIAFD